MKLSFFHNNTEGVRTWISKRNQGFSLLELLVVILIAVILSTITLLNFPLFSARQSLQVSAEEVAQTIREAQIYGISIKAADGSINPAPHYGIFVSAANTAITNPAYANKIILFVDKNDSGQYDAGTGACGSATTECTKEISVKDPNLIFTLCYNQTGLPIDILKPDTADKGYLCGNSTYEAIKTVTVLFKRPNTEPEIKVVSTRGSIITPINYVKIVISGPDTVQKSIYISRIGQIAVNNFGRPPAPVGCPAIFTWNGTSFVFEHEAVPFAYTKFFEGTSFTALQNPYLENNILHLRVAEEKNEISFIDQVGVLAVDAPRGSGTVFPGDDGKVYVVKDEEKPLSCLLGEVSCTEEAQTEDNVPFALGATVNDTGNVSNNEAIFTFKKPEASHARLLILAKANPLAEQSAFLYGALAKPAFSVAEFLSPISTFPEDRIKQLAKDYKIAIDIKKDGQWHEVAVRNFGDGKPFITDVDLSGLAQEEKVEIRLRSLGWYSVDKVSLDTTLQPDLIVHTLPLVNQDEAVSVRDKKYLTLHEGDFKDISFSSAPPSLDKERTYIFSLSGYYDIPNTQGVGKSLWAISRLIPGFLRGGLSEEALPNAIKATQ